MKWVMLLCLCAAALSPMYILIDDALLENNHESSDGIRYFQEIGDGGEWLTEPLVNHPNDSKKQGIMRQWFYSSESVITFVSYAFVVVTCLAALSAVSDHYSARQCYHRNRDPDLV
eukprot:Blabericola_migrator_1__4456@NODE_2386_length_2847_cov_92_710432_g1494_i0_p3_GENE_NODE_2386_length_2847_cov_92_710432_g1494_i0NODE_2386_length_2847_cov_92_710432_g1494_i0_p3_ORF_typecomplete_len116_score6_00MgtE/PF01769_16/0_011_NODE_2386_length_2847_cov_92_710432_g1494_i011921539